MFASSAWAEPKSYQYNSASGRWTESQPRAATTAPPANPWLDRGQRLFDARQYQRVHDDVLCWLLRNPKAPDRDRGILLLADAYFALGDRLWCFFECDELIENFPDSKLFFPALALQYRVADDYLNGYRKKFLGLHIVPMEDAGIEMLFRIQQRAPGSPIAEKSLLRTADYYYRSSQFDLAADAYGAYLRIYPRSPAVPRIRLRQAYSNFAQFHGPAYDSTPLLDARTQFMEIQSLTPDLAREEGVQQFIDRIEEHLAAKIRVDAEYYLRVHQPKAAVFLYRSLIQRYPNTRDAKSARAILAKMPASALTDPWPPISSGELPPPTTRPTLGP
ncbi:MAG TPA: outer membrane protein assembly factor BamD [Tepidisphaeraceae bacterium]|jgi:outer membrane assembly lipoprotein YfiO|nr:outer membrane protein assembly factor BamD [Tepidisphaeraceae bacterium]